MLTSHKAGQSTMKCQNVGLLTKINNVELTQCRCISNDYYSWYNTM